jgi:Uma2 family endonuclease
MPDLVRRWTREEVLALPDDGNRYELFDGELLVTPAPTGPHQVALGSLFSLLAPYVPPTASAGRCGPPRISIWVVTSCRSRTVRGALSPV